MSDQFQTAFAVPSADERADTQALNQQLGSAEELTSLSPIIFARQLLQTRSLDDLRKFLVDYQQSVLHPREFAWIYQAYSHASRNETRELIAYDNSLRPELLDAEFVTASQNVGRRQLNKLKPLKDVRLIQRYREAVRSGKAHGWHTLVYGVVLATYSIPLRQGLIHYGQQTISGFIDAASRNLELPELDCQRLRLELCHAMPAAVQTAISENSVFA